MSDSFIQIGDVWVDATEIAAIYTAAKLPHEQRSGLQPVEVKLRSSNSFMRLTPTAEQLDGWADSPAEWVLAQVHEVRQRGKVRINVGTTSRHTQSQHERVVAERDRLRLRNNDLRLQRDAFADELAKKDDTTRVQINALKQDVENQRKARLAAEAQTAVDKGRLDHLEERVAANLRLIADLRRSNAELTQNLYTQERARLDHCTNLGHKQAAEQLSEVVRHNQSLRAKISDLMRQARITAADLEALISE